MGVIQDPQGAYFEVWEAKMNLGAGLVNQAGALSWNESSGWLVYFGTDDIEASTAKVNELGGGLMARPMDIGVGKVAVVADPQGAVFALYAGRFED